MPVIDAERDPNDASTRSSGGQAETGTAAAKTMANRWRSPGTDSTTSLCVRRPVIGGRPAGASRPPVDAQRASL